MTRDDHEFFERKLDGIVPDTGLQRALAPGLNARRHAVCALARDEHNWPLDKYFCAEQVEFLAIFLALREYAFRLDYFAGREILQRIRGDFERKFHQARGIDRKNIGIASRFKRASYASVAAQLDYKECDALLAVVERRYAALYPRHKGALPRVRVEIRKLLIVAGLTERQAETYAKEIVAQHCPPVLEKQKKARHWKNNRTFS